MAETKEPTPDSKSTKRASVRTLVVLGAVAISIYLLDQAAKYVALQNLELRDPVKVIGELLQFYLVKNSGAAFSLGSGVTWIFAALATTVVVLIIVFARRIKSIGWAFVFGLLLGGTLGNLSDRYFREPGFGSGHVIDYIQIWGFPAIFNIADIAITSAMVLFIILTLRGIHLDGTRTVKAESDTTSESA